MRAADVIKTFHSQPEVGEVTDPFLSGHQADYRRFIVELPMGYRSWSTYERVSRSGGALEKGATPREASETGYNPLDMNVSDLWLIFRHVLQVLKRYFTRYSSSIHVTDAQRACRTNFSHHTSVRGPAGSSKIERGGHPLVASRQNDLPCSKIAPFGLGR